MTLLALLLFAAPTAEQLAQERFNAGDYEGALDHYVAWAAEPGTHVQDALWGAHESLLGLHKKTGDIDPLCRAYQLAQDVLGRDDFRDDNERDAWHELRATDAQNIDAASASAGRPMCAPTTTAEELLPVQPRPARPRLAAPRTPLKIEPHGTGLLISGGVLLSAAAALGGVATYRALQRDLLVQNSREIRDTAAMQGYVDPTTAGTWNELKHEVAAQHRMVLVSSITSGILGGVAVALITTGAHRRRTPARLAARPMLTGVLFTARF